MSDVTITKEQFHQYESIRQDGLVNMITQSNAIMEKIGVNKDQYLHILDNYSQLLKQHGESNE